MRNYVKFASRVVLLVLLDIFAVNLSVYLSLVIRLDTFVPQNYFSSYLNAIIPFTVISILINFAFSLYNSIWKYAGVDEIIQIFLATFVGTIVTYITAIFMNIRFPLSTYVIRFILVLIFISAIRFSYRILRKLKVRLFRGSFSDLKKVMIIGAGEAGSHVIKEMKTHPELRYDPVAVIDDNILKHRSKIHGVPIVGGRYRIKEIVEKKEIDEIIIALPSSNLKELSKIIKICKETSCKLKRLPGVYELINNKVSIKQIRDVSIEDLLGRDEIKLNTEEISDYLEDEVVLVTGGGGSIGSELCRQIANFKPKKLIILDIYENNAYDLQNELLSKYGGDLNLEVVIASVREKEKMKQILKNYHPGVIFHAAAHKHVPLMEANPSEAIKNNVFGTLNVAQAADEAGVKRFVLISTDKAVNPTNVMGATKRIGEMIVQSLDKISRTEFVAVRFGNVLGSNGSVIPLFQKQIAKGGPVTVTHPEITRFFMTIPEASRLVIQAGAMAKGGEIFVLDMGEPVKIVDLARDLIKLSGFEPDTDIKIKFTGLRPGEKLYEELMLSEEGIEKTVHESIFVAQPLDLSYNEVMMCLRMFENVMEDNEGVREVLAKIVPTYKRPEQDKVEVG